MRISDYRARYYDPTSGRFLNEDPLSINGDDLNFYRYVGNGPVSFYDPIGWQRVNSPRTGPPNSTGWFPDPNSPGDVTVRVFGPNGDAVTDYDYGHDHTGAGDPPAHDWGRDKNGKPVRGKPRPIKPGEKVPPPACPKKETPPQPYQVPVCTPEFPYDCVPDFRPHTSPFFPWLPPIPEIPLPGFSPIEFPIFAPA
jgi:hypothetical protein